MYFNFNCTLIKQSSAITVDNRMSFDSVKNESYETIKNIQIQKHLWSVLKLSLWMASFGSFMCEHQLWVHQCWSFHAVSYHFTLLPPQLRNNTETHYCDGPGARPAQRTDSTVTAAQAAARHTHKLLTSFSPASSSCLFDICRLPGKRGFWKRGGHAADLRSVVRLRRDLYITGHNINQ